MRIIISAFFALIFICSGIDARAEELTLREGIASQEGFASQFERTETEAAPQPLPEKQCNISIAGSCGSVVVNDTRIFNAVRSDKGKSATLPINVHGFCRYVDNKASSTADYFVPFKTDTEWNAFLANPPSGIDLVPCATPTDFRIEPNDDPEKGPVCANPQPASHSVSFGYVRTGSPPEIMTHEFTCTTAGQCGECGCSPAKEWKQRVRTVFVPGDGPWVKREPIRYAGTPAVTDPPPACTYNAEFDECPSQCGQAATTLNPARCIRTYDGEQVDVARCAGQTKSCPATAACCTATSWTLQWASACSKTCGGGTRRARYVSNCGDIWENPREVCNAQACVCGKYATFQDAVSRAVYRVWDPRPPQGSFAQWFNPAGLGYGGSRAMDAGGYVWYSIKDDRGTHYATGNTGSGFTPIPEDIGSIKVWWFEYIQPRSGMYVIRNVDIRRGDNCTTYRSNAVGIPALFNPALPGTITAASKWRDPIYWCSYYFCSTRWQPLD